MIKDLLNKHKIKATNQRIEIIETLKEKGECSIKDLEQALPNIDKSTLYRTMELFLEKNLIDKILLNQVIVYTLKEHHRHYLNCIKCHKKVAIKNCPFDYEELEGFKIINHTINIEGICNNCQKKSN